MNGRFITSYEEAKRMKPGILRGYARNLALSGLSLTANRKYLNTPRVQFLYIHHVFADEEQTFLRLLDNLAKNHEFISYGDAIEKILTAKIDRPYISFSCDDGFKNNLRTAALLNEHGAKACFFINPGIIGETNFDKISEYCAKALDFPPVEFLDWSEVKQLQKMGHEIGSHTMRHMNMANATGSEIKTDLQQSADLLVQNCGHAKHFAFPYGRFSHFSREAKNLVFQSGFTSCASAERGCHINPLTPMHRSDLCVRRDYTVIGRDADHIMYFLTRNARTASAKNNFFPDNLK